MSKLDLKTLDLGVLDTLSFRQSPVHRIDARAKLLTTLAFILVVASFDRYTISALLPFCLFPVLLVTAGGLPAGFLLRKLLLVAPFAVLIGLFNPLLDPLTRLTLGPLAISGGWISFLSILLRFVLTVSAALILIATTSFPGVCRALEQLGAPRVFAVQLLFLYRYIFVLIEEAARLVRARNLRSFGGRGRGLKSFGALIGQLLLRTVARSQRIHTAMLSRGFDGEFRSRTAAHFGTPEWLFLTAWSLFFLLARWVDLPRLLGRAFTEWVT